MDNRANEIVLGFIRALNEEDFKKAQNYVTDDMKFDGVLGKRDGADAYFKDMQKMRLKYDILQSYADENGAAVFYHITMDGKKIFTAGWYQLENGKIKNIRVVFDPRTLLADKKE